MHRAWLAQNRAAAAPMNALGAWVKLALRAAELELPVREDGQFGWGRIPDLAQVDDRALLSSIGITQLELQDAVDAGLASWDGDDLLVDGYDLEGHRAFAAMREGGRKGGSKGAIRGVEKGVEAPFKGPGKERKGKERRGEEGGGKAEREIFDHWRSAMGKRDTARLTSDRRSKISARLGEGYGVDDLKRAIDGCRRSSWHMGDNDRHQPFNDLVTILKSGKSVEEHMARVDGNGVSRHGRARPATQEELAAAEAAQAADPNTPEWAR